LIALAGSACGGYTAYMVYRKRKSDTDVTIPKKGA
jgi:hypothetical protein